MTWTREKLKLFKRAYMKALRNGDAIFWFDGHEFIPAYARYLIEYLEGRGL